MKKVLLLGTILAATVAHQAMADAAVATPQAGCPKAFQGFHLGGNIGYGIGFGKHTFSDAAKSDDDTSFTTIQNISSDLGVRGVDGGIGVGYTHRLCNWALGLNFDANWTDVKGSAKSVDRVAPFRTLKLHARLENSLQLYGRLGYVMREIAMPYIGLGWDNSQWKQTSVLSQAATGDEEEGTDAVNRTSSKKKRLNAFLWKAGVDFLATKHVVVGFEYTGTYGGKVKYSKDFPVPAQEGTYRHSGSFKPQYNKFALTAKIVY